MNHLPIDRSRLKIGVYSLIGTTNDVGIQVDKSGQ